MRFLIASMLVMLAGVACSQEHPKLETLVIQSKSGKHTFQVEIAATPVAQEIGLMYREHLEPDHGMLFEMEKERITAFWMKNTLIPLDMLFIAQDGTIKGIHENATPKSLESISSEVPVSGVLEINGGLAKKLGIAVGDRVIHSFFKPMKSQNNFKN
jgi:uncharacterized membrane protein (UPF0127 family)